MQITIIGKFRSGSSQETVGRLDLADDYCEDTVIFLKDSSQAVKEFDAGLKTSLVICGPEIDMNGLITNLEMLGIAVPAMIQLEQSESIDNDHQQKTQKSGIDRSQMRESCLWIGSETNPLQLGQRLADMERTLILQTLAHCGGNRTHAADILGISSRTLRTKLQQYTAEGCTVASSRFRQSEQTASQSGFARPAGVLVS